MDHTGELPPSVADIAEYLAGSAKNQGGNLKWNEQSKFKADLMNARARWHGVAPNAFAAKLREEGMREEDVTELVGWLRKAQAGGRLVPHSSYRGFTFGPPPEALSGEAFKPALDW